MSSCHSPCTKCDDGDLASRQRSCYECYLYKPYSDLLLRLISVLNRWINMIFSRIKATPGYSKVQSKLLNTAQLPDNIDDSNVDPLISHSRSRTALTRIRAMESWLSLLNVHVTMPNSLCNGGIFINGITPARPQSSNISYQFCCRHCNANSTQSHLSRSQANR